MAGQRPVGVWLVAIIAWLNGLVSISQGIVALANGAESLNVWGAWVVIAIGVIIILVSIGLFRGNNAARVIVTIVFVLSLIANVLSMFNGQILGGVIGAVLAVAGIVLLYTKAANRFFRD